jgi:Poly(ADP-ribose) polymerase catalytic domain
LKCEITTLKQGSDEYNMVAEYLDNTRGGYNVKLLDVFKLNRTGEEMIYNPNKYGNKKLLWHGSRFSNFVGIIS